MKGRTDYIPARFNPMLPGMDRNIGIRPLPLPIDHGGYGRTGFGSVYNMGGRRGGAVRYGEIPHGVERTGIQRVHPPDDDLVDDDKEYDHPCGEDCNRNEFLCVRSCVCIESAHRYCVSIDRSYKYLGCHILIYVLARVIYKLLFTMFLLANKFLPGNLSRSECRLFNITARESYFSGIFCRCDGETDCQDDEDELDCGEENYRQQKCEEADNKVRCPSSGKCISKDWLCDGEDDCGDYSDETQCKRINLARFAYEKQSNRDLNDSVLRVGT